MILEEERLKNEFISNATHEFRTPLAIMRGAVELALLDKKKIPQPAKEALQIVEKEIIYLSLLIADLALLVSSQKDERNSGGLTPILMQDFLNKMVKRLKILSDKKGIKIKISNKSPRLVIMGDEKYLEKLFLNLIRNSITYGKHKGSTLIDVHKKHDRVVVKVVDNGIGISKEELPLVFDRFFRTEKARAMTSIGTGLGLAIAKRITESHGGKINAKSEEGKSTTFTVELPVGTK